MKKATIRGQLPAGVAAFLVVTVHAAVAQQPAASPPLVFDRVTVVDVREGKLVRDQRVVVVGTRIQAIGKRQEVPLPPLARRVDARGKYLIPGLWDMHVHPTTYVDIAYPLFIANGVTGVRDAGSNVPLATFQQWKREIAAGTRIGPRLIVSGKSIDEGSDWALPALSPHLMVPSADARRIVDSLKVAGADMIKTYGMSREMYFAIAAEARRVGIRFGGHLPAGVSGLEASDSGVTILDHETWFRPNVCGDHVRDSSVSLEACRSAAQLLRRNNTWVALFSQFARSRVRVNTRVLRYLPASLSRILLEDSSTGPPPAVYEPASTADWARVAKGQVPTVTYSAELFLADMPIVVGTDAGIASVLTLVNQWTPGFLVHEALVGFVLRGMRPLAALRTATLNPALALRATDSLGAVEAGKLADMVLLDADPLKDIWNTNRIRAVVANGRYYDRAALDNLLITAERAARAHDHDSIPMRRKRLPRKPTPP